MCYAVPVAAPAPQAGPETFVDDIDAFAWLDDLEEDEEDMGLPALPANASAAESAESSQIKMEGEAPRLRLGPGQPQGAGPRAGSLAMPSRPGARALGPWGPARGPGPPP
jgi:hypothetical protein